MEPPTAMTTVKERVAVLSMNIFARPEGIHSGKWFSSGDFKDLRISLLLRKIQDFDIVILQEMFEVGVRQKRFLRDAERLGFHYHCGSVWPSLTDRYLIDGGLLILSRFPIVERDQHAYTVGSGSDGICSKGVLYARVQLSSDLADSLHVFTTHTQAGDRIKEYKIRAAQLQEMHKFIKRTIRDDQDAPVLITGDFNLDARHNLAHDPKTGLPLSSHCRESDVYLQLVQDLQRALNSTAGGEDRQVIDLMKHHDTTKLENATHPITNGDGHSSLIHESDPTSLEKDGKCIDYMFFSPSTRVLHATGNDSSAHSFQLRVVESKTTVDHCDIANLVDDPSLLPITHLSDHYGLRAEFELEVVPVAHPDGETHHTFTRLYELLQLHFPRRAFAQTPKRLWMWKLLVGLLTIAASSLTVLGVIGAVVHAALGFRN
uniref:sphingomyelin phosphodiesterase n=1 Tax=Globisporangium ultimum (strain ATCC 200006 / CBS 805.95 / DAOM BR144) TaxID=431595 RepID=K3XBZ0_GLOUD